MKKSFKKFLLHSLSVCLSAFMLASFSVSAMSWDVRMKQRHVVAAAEMVTPKNRAIDGMSLLANTKQKEYVKDVKFITGDSLEDAKKYLPEGYRMVETDLNQGAAIVSSVDDVYLAYSVTSNPEEAITEQKLRAMRRAASAYMAQRHSMLEPKFSLIAVEMVGDRVEALRFVEDALQYSW